MALKVTVKLESRLFQQTAFRKDLEQAVTRAAFALEGEAKVRVQQGNKSGRTYRRGPITAIVGAKRAKEFTLLGLKRARDHGPFKGKNQAKFVVGFKLHRASAPGESPASDSSHLANSIRAKPAKSDQRGVHAQLEVSAAYGLPLEEGAKGTGKKRTGRIAPRPFIAPSLEKIAPEFLANVEQLVAQAVR
jgi:hypothetical protein